MTITETERCPRCRRRSPGLRARLRRIHWKLVFLTTFGTLWTGLFAWWGAGAAGVINACFGLALALAGAYALGLMSRRHS